MTRIGTDKGKDFLINSKMSETPLNNGAKRRDRHDILVDILKTAKGGMKRTNLMHRAKLSHTQLKLYLYVLSENGLLESNDGMVKTTTKGTQFVKVFESLNFFVFS
ncbi:MAG TPA: winged helix-turn-helix domain-containing protein [Candidatus Bathyarchaeia archaeon]|nr:winged helix-turn-helix domain-containing protein [Candidatus Bathyarchaeia archaeon]